MTELVHNFRDALLALTPMLDGARVPWREPDAYDDWNTVCETLFSVLVVSPLRYAVPDGLLIEFPRYGFSYYDYSKFSYLNVTTVDQSVGAFQELIADRAVALTSACCARLSDSGTVTDRTEVALSDTHRRLPRRTDSRCV